MDDKDLRQHDESSRRTKLLKHNIVASFAIKGWSVAMQFLLVPLTLHCLGAYENGLWMTISSMLLWIDNLDIGLGNGLRNKLAEHLAHNDIDKARRVVASTFFMLIVLIVPVCVLINILIWNVDVYSFFNVDDKIVNDLRTVLSLTTIMVCSTFVFKFIGNFYMGLQLPAVNNLFVALGHTLTVLGVGAAYLCGSRSLLLIAAVYTVSPLCIYLISYPVTFYGRKYSQLRPKFTNVTSSMVKELLNIGVKFFVLQIAGIVLFMSSNIIISRLFSPDMVTPYQISYRYFSAVLLVFTIICVPYWTATTDAYQRKDKEWIIRSSRILNRLIAFAAGLMVVMVVLSKPVYKIWIGDVVEIPLPMSSFMAVYFLILNVFLRYSYILNGFGTLNLQLIMTVLAAVLFIPISIWVGTATKDINYLFVVMCLVHLPGLIVNYVQYHKIINGRAKGIWIK